MVVFIDTSAFYALLDARDQNHGAARAAWTQWQNPDYEFSTSNYVIVESVALIQRRLGMAATRDFLSEFVPLLHMHWVDGEIHAAAAGAMLAAGQRDLSLVDCTTFELMHRLGLRTVFAFDQHFAEQGFTRWP